MFNYYRSAIDVGDHEFIDDLNIPLVETVEFSACGVIMVIIQDDKNLNLILVSLAAAAKVFLDAKKDECVFYEPEILINPKKATITLKIKLIEKIKYQEYIKIKEGK